ncbi:MAG: DUF6089 family protein [Paludibacter sp.]|nr:DUF6089 family protein [Paludibacter sp.]
MIYRIIRCSLAVLFSLFVFQLPAQSDYLAEIGINAGGSYMLDNHNGVPFKNSKLDFGVIYRHNFNERLSAHAEWNNTRISFFNQFSALPIDTIGLNMIDFCGEFNFFDLIKKEYKPMSKSFSPYIFAGLGMAFTQNTVSVFPFGYGYIPFGIGIKYKMGNRFNVNAKWAHRLIFNDKIEGTESVLNGTNFLNNDLNSTFTIGVSYDFWKKPCDCNNSHLLKKKK